MNTKQLEHAGKITISRLQAKKLSGKKISIVTAYDYPSAKVVDSAGIDAILVGDSLGNVVQGRQTTLPVTLEQMIYHAQMVMRAVKNAMVIVDMPFPTCQTGATKAIEAAAKMIKETEADAIKIEGGQNRIETVRAVVDAGIPV
jgi:3-methyl-2-oxobutanoate hydroxymethyltransferase